MIQVGEPKGRSAVILDSKWVKEHGVKLSPYAFKLYCILLAFANKDSEAWPKRATLALMVGVKMRKITYLFRELESYDLLEKVSPNRDGVVVKWRILKF